MQTVTATKSAKYLGLAIDNILSGEQMASDIIWESQLQIKIHVQAGQFLWSKNHENILLCPDFVFIWLFYCILVWWSIKNYM